jgi:translation initiation factor 4B
MSKKKSTKVNLSEFLQNEKFGSWADDVDTLIPTAPSRTTQPEIQNTSRVETQVPFPSVPPFNCFVGNLNFDVSDTDLETFFANLNIKSVRIIVDQETRLPKGFGS